MSGFPSTYARNFVVNPSGTNPGALETYMRCGAWWALELPFKGMPDLRSGGDDNLIVPEVDGRIPLQEFIDQGTYVIELRVCGAVNASGVNTPASGSALTVLEQNIEFLKTNIGRPPAAITRTSKYIRPWVTLTDDIQSRLRFGTQKGSEITAAWTVTVPGGVYGG